MSTQVYDSAFCSPMQCKICQMMDCGENDSAKFKNQHKRLLKCGCCSMVWYCSPEHQRADWLNHRDICKAVKTILTEVKIKHPLDILGEIKNRSDLSKVVRTLKDALRAELQRDLNYVEKQVVNFIPHCAVCFSHNYLIPCKDCYGVAYCSKEHADMHATEHKTNECHILAIYYSPFKMRKVKLQVIIHYIDRIASLRDTDLYGAFELATTIKLPLDPTKSFKTFQLYNAAADFSYVATICYVMEHLNMKDFKSSLFVIYIIGATVENVTWFQRPHVKFFFSQYPQIKELQLYFIGPNVINKPQNHLFIDMHGVMRHVSHKTFNLSFAEFMVTYDSSPSLMVSYNNGFADYPDTVQPTNLKTWNSILKYILLTTNVVFMFTTVSLMQAKFNFAQILRTSLVADGGRPIEVNPIFDCIRNPYRDIRPFRNWRFADDEDFFYRNNYLQAVISTPFDNDNCNNFE